MDLEAMRPALPRLSLIEHPEIVGMKNPLLLRRIDFQELIRKWYIHMEFCKQYNPHPVSSVNIRDHSMILVRVLRKFKKKIDFNQLKNDYSLSFWNQT